MLLTFIAASKINATAVIIAPIMPPKKYAENSNAGLSANQPYQKQSFLPKQNLHKFQVITKKGNIGTIDICISI